MFNYLGTIVSKHWIAVLLVWAALVAGVRAVAPSWDSITYDGDFAYLPGRTTSVRGEKLLDRAFPVELAKSQVVVIVARPGGPLTPADLAIADLLVREFTPKTPDEGPVFDVWSHQTEVFGRKLTSREGPAGQATLVMLRLRTEFMAVGNMPVVKSVLRRIDKIRHLAAFPAGLRLEVTGSASLGADILFSAEESIVNTERTTVALVVVILLLVYRAPGLVVIPLVTITASIVLAKDLIGLLVVASQHTKLFEFSVFKTTQIFIVVILFGAGTDFCLFLIARYREEMRRGMGAKEAIGYALGQVGHALAGSAATTILGLATMTFADFGKYRNGGPAIALALTVALAASLTLAPALLRALGRGVFWPFGIGSEAKGSVGKERGVVQAAPSPPAPLPLDISLWSVPKGRGESAIAGSRVADNPVDVAWRDGLWDRLSRMIIARPGWILVVSTCVLAPLAWTGLSVPVNYNLVSELQADRPIVRGTAVLQKYFQPGDVGPVTVLAYQKNGRFDSDDGQRQIAQLTRYLSELVYTQPGGTRIRAVIGVRSLTEPLGDAPGSFNPFSVVGRQKLAVLKHPKVKSTFVSQSGEFAHRVTRFDLILPFSPFSRENIRLFNFIESRLQAIAAQDSEGRPIDGYPEDRSADWAGTEFDFVGITPGIRDLEQVTGSDLILIQRLVVLAVMAVIVTILRHPVVCVYLILSVLFSYFITIGATELLFEWFYGPTYHGLDWKVPMFLFVILIAVGQDYNIYLVTRVFEEQDRYGALAGLRRALVHTGGIITSCGVIMAGTFVSMMTGTLRGMQELGLALSFGVLLDTLVIRTILVPAFLALLGNSRTSHSDPSQDQAVPAAQLAQRQRSK